MSARYKSTNIIIPEKLSFMGNIYLMRKSYKSKGEGEVST